MEVTSRKALKASLELKDANMLWIECGENLV